ncbi:PIN domain-containing protein [Candidatus Woesearchaeota archaeon]|nr:PIN domain-containing protein [Candidatus Woesearchaeota archaeon]
MPKYFFDSTILVDYLKGNQKAANVINENEWTITLLNVLEVAHIVSRDFGEEAGKSVTKHLFDLLAIPTRNDIDEAIVFRLQNRKLDFSYADALGYTYAKRRNMAFLTADRAFKGLPNVEFAEFSG